MDVGLLDPSPRKRSLEPGCVYRKVHDCAHRSDAALWKRCSFETIRVNSKDAHGPHLLEPSTQERSLGPVSQFAQIKKSMTALIGSIINAAIRKRSFETVPETMESVHGQHLWEPPHKEGSLEAIRVDLEVRSLPRPHTTRISLQGQNYFRVDSQ
eukprot:765419-Amphidinium_carterae.1